MRTDKFKSLKKVDKYFNELLKTDFNINGTVVNLYKEGYQFQWDNAKRRFGRCYYQRRLISISKSIAYENLRTKNVLKNVFLHEMAHAFHFIVYNQSGHDRLWKQICILIGGDGEARYDPNEVNIPESKYTLLCPACGHMIPKHRKPKRITSCGHCDNKFNPDKILKVIQNY